MADIPLNYLNFVALSRIKQPFKLETFCFKEQLDFIRDPARFKTAVCSRRAGKTVACAADLVHTAITTRESVCLYITLSRINAKRIIWPELLKINATYRLGGTPNETELFLRFPNGSVIYISGANDKTEIDKFRGLALKKVYLDESQAFRSFIQELVQDVLAKALYDYNGTLALIGTPGPVPTGYYYDASHSPKWSNHKWTMFQNPFIQHKSGRSAMDLVLEDCAQMGVAITHPKIQRECYGRWIVDTESLVFQYDVEKQHYDAIPETSEPWEYVLGIDIGHDDADAIAVLGWNPQLQEVYLVEEFIKHKQGITELGLKIHELMLTYKPFKIVADLGALGKKIGEEIKKRFEIPLEAAEKIRKFEHIELLNDAMRRGVFKAKKDSVFAQDCLLVEWDTDVSDPERKKISEKYHSDVCFVSGTLITTHRGKIPIEEVIVGDLALTRKGFRKVVASAQTHINTDILFLSFSNGSVLKCTPSHPIFTLERGFVRADALLYSDRFVSEEQWLKDNQNQEKLFGLKGDRLSDIPNQKGRTSETIFGPMMENSGSHYTERYGLIITELFRKIITFIIKTGTHLITIYQTWNASVLKRTGKSIKKQGENGGIHLNAKPIWRLHETLHQNGMHLKRVLNGISSMLGTGVKKIEYALKKSVVFVERAIDGTLYQKQQSSIAQTLVEPRLEGNQGKMMLTGLAAYAPSHLCPADLKKGSTVVGLVQLPFRIGNDSVYNLTVEGEHEYFANGILVSNCDAALYAFRVCLHWLSKPEPPKPKPYSPEYFNKQAAEIEEMLMSQFQHKKRDDNLDYLMWNDGDETF